MILNLLHLPLLPGQCGHHISIPTRASQQSICRTDLFNSAKIWVISHPEELTSSWDHIEYLSSEKCWTLKAKVYVFAVVILGDPKYN